MSSISVVILAGGQGTRLKPIMGDIPKSLLNIKDKPLLIWQVKKFIKNGFDDVHLNLGYGSNDVISALKNHNMNNLNISIENEPIGTGGALIKNLKKYKDKILVLNCDTWLKLDFKKIQTLQNKNKNYIFMYPVSTNRDQKGLIKVNGDNLVVEFHEKKISSSEQFFINQGHYLFDKTSLKIIPTPIGNYSIEYDLIPKLVSQKNLFGIRSNQKSIDLGTPDEIKMYSNIIKNGFNDV